MVVRRDFLESIIGLIQEEGRTVFHDRRYLVHEVERVADRVAVIEQGRLVAEGPVDEVKLVGQAGGGAHAGGRGSTDRYPRIAGGAGNRGACGC